MIGIIGAMRAEVEALIEKLENKSVEVLSGISFYRGKLMGREVVIASCGVGKVFAALCAQSMILKHAPEYILHTGVAGSLTAGLAVGSIALGEKLVQHDMDTSALGDPKGLISGINLTYLPTDDALREEMSIVAEKLGYPYAVGCIASGDRFVSETAQKRAIAKDFGAIACEMEGAAIAQVCYVNETPVCVIRAISDSLEGDGAMEYPVFLKLAAERAVNLILTFLNR